MRGITSLGCVLALPVALAGAAPLDAPGGHSSSQVIVQLRRAAPPHDERLDATLSRWRAIGLRPLFEGPFARPRLARRLGLDRYYRVLLPPGTDTPAVVGDLRGHRDLVARAGLDPIGGVSQALPDDPDFALQWALRNTGQVIGGQAGVPGVDLGVLGAWARTAGDEEIVLAVLDAGMDPHVELAGRMVPGRNVAAHPDNNDTSDVCISHGTHVAGIAAAATGNGAGIAGVDGRCRIMPVRVLDECSGPESYVAEGIVWAADNGADVINMSLQYFDGSPQLLAAVRYAHASGVVMVAASGNLDALEVTYPARWPETIAVGAIDNLGERWHLSNGGPNLDVVAPGHMIWSLDGASGYKFLSGTSMAAPHASGVASLLKALDRELSPDAIRDVLRQTARDLDAPGVDDATGSGLIDASAALDAAVPPADIDGDGAVSTSDLLILLSAWGACPAPPRTCAADLDRDGEVSTSDLLALLAAW